MSNWLVRVVDLVPTTITAMTSAKSLALPLERLPPIPVRHSPSRCLRLRPIEGWSRAVGRRFALRNDALQPMPLSRLKELGAVFESLDRLQAGEVATDQAHQQLLARGQRRVCQIILVAAQEIEYVDRKFITPRSQRSLQAPEIGSATRARQTKLAVEHCGMARERPESLRRAPAGVGSSRIRSGCKASPGGRP